MMAKKKNIKNPFNKNLNLNDKEIKKILSNSRQIFMEKKYSNLDYLLNKRYTWIDREISGLKDILEIGSGAGLSKFYIKNKFVTSDIIKNKWINFSFNAEKIPFPNNSFDCVFVCQTILHFKDPIKFFLEVNRVFNYFSPL